MFGITYIEQVLTGQSSERSLTNGHEALSVWSIVEPHEAPLVKPVARALMLRDALRANEHGGLEFGPGARGLLKGNDTLSVVAAPKRERRGKRTTVGANPADDPQNGPLFEALRERRRELAKDAGVPPYVIFHDSTLRDMAAQRPSSRAALAHLSGIGARKLEAYGDAFLEVIRHAA
jgi:ATP-dependent DNA helicase RecQ